VGHLALVAATGLLPWCVLAVTTTERPWPRARTWAAIMALTGSAGAVVGLVPLAWVALRAPTDRPGPEPSPGSPRWLTDRAGRLAWLLAAQAVWVLPGVVAVLRGVPLPETSVSAFATVVDGFEGWARILVGGGFFIAWEDMADLAGPWSLALAALLGALALAGAILTAEPGGSDGSGAPGASSVSEPDRAGGAPTPRDPLGVIAFSAAIGALLVIAPALPLVASAWNALVSLGPLTILREPHKFWPLASLGLLVAASAVLFDQRNRRLHHAATAALLVLVLVVARPGLWGAGGRLDAAESPAAWTEITRRIDAEPGTVVVLPWNRYEVLDLSEGRVVIQPVPWLLWPDDAAVLISADPLINPGALERDEPLETVIDDLDAEVRAARPIGPDLAQLGVRWVVVPGSPEAAFYRRLGNEPELAMRVDEGNYLLVEVLDPGPWTARTSSTLAALGALSGWLWTALVGLAGTILGGFAQTRNEP
jgi:hypothetical protein